MVRLPLGLWTFVAILLYFGDFSGAAAFSNGYVLGGTMWGRTTSLFDNTCTPVFTWNHTVDNGYSCYLLENGNLLRSTRPPNLHVSMAASPQQGGLEEADSSGKALWSYTLATSTQMMHHDFKSLPNGNILAVSFETVLKEDAIKFGVDSSVFPAGIKSFESEMIFELKPDRSGAANHQIIWEWHVIDHVASKDLVATHPELFDGTHPTWTKFNQQWFHINGIDYDAKKKLIVFSSRVFSEVYVIDHSTTTELAEGHTGGTYGKGGDIIYRWGYPANYRASGGTTINTLHCPTWIPEGYPGAGHIMFFHNNNDQSMKKIGSSQVIEINPWDASGKFFTIASGAAPQPLEPTWSYKPDNMYSASMSTALRLKSGNTIVEETFPDSNHTTKSSTVREVTPSGALAGSIQFLNMGQEFNPSKIMYYAADYPGVVKLLGNVGAKIPGAVASRRLQTMVGIAAGTVNFSNVAGADIAVYSLYGAKVASVHSSTTTCRLSTASLPAGTYMVEVRAIDGKMTDRVVSIVR